MKSRQTKLKDLPLKGLSHAHAQQLTFVQSLQKLCASQLKLNAHLQLSLSFCFNLLQTKRVCADCDNSKSFQSTYVCTAIQLIRIPINATTDINELNSFFCLSYSFLLKLTNEIIFSALKRWDFLIPILPTGELFSSFRGRSSQSQEQPIPPAT